MPDPNRTWGDAVHEAFEYLYQGKSVEDTLQLVDLSGLETLQEFGDFHTTAALRRALDEYGPVLDEDLERFEVISTEGDLKGKLTTNLVWLGKIDLVLREKATGQVFVVDHKTTGKKVDSSFWTDQFSHDQQMTSYWWLARSHYGEDFAGLLINGCQTTKTIGWNHARTVVSRDQWQIDEWYSNMLGLGPVITNAYELGAKFLDAGLREYDPEVLNVFPICNTYSENFCDYRFLNRAHPEIREDLIRSDFTLREERHGPERGGEDD